MFTYVPAPHERAYYGVLFQAADVERTSSIGGAKAVEFFTRSKLPITVLKEIWSASDQPATNALDPAKFAVAVRLIQLEQNGIKPAASDLAQGVPPNLRPAFFEGIPVPGAATAAAGQPVPPAQQQMQQMQQAPLTPPRPPMAPPNNSSSSVAGSVTSAPIGFHGNHQLTVQDPYTLTPAEQSRYEQLFPEYCSKQDPDYMYGAEAVALFNKSGLPQPLLAQIWNMVDTPVDNRLDRLEFAIAMHLIVCVSKKHLPMPAALPMSLKQLKSQQAPAASINGFGGPTAPLSPPRTFQQQQQQQQQQQPMMNNDGKGGGHQAAIPTPPLSMMHSNMSTGGGGFLAAGGGGGGGGMPPSSMGQADYRGMVPPPSPMVHGGQPGGMSMGMMGATGSGGGPPPLSGLQGPPPLAQTGGMSISDAFEGLGGTGDTGSISSYRASTPVPSSGFPMAQSYDQVGYNQSPRVTLIVPEPDPAPAQQRSAPNPSSQQKLSSQQLASSYDMGEANEELEKLRDALQKLQAENISLKAKMGTLTDEEHDIQKELNATIAEVTKLASELTKSRAQVLASKSRLLESTAELKAAKEKKGVLKDLIADVSATKNVIDEAYQSIENVNEAVRAAPSLPMPAVTEEADLFGGWGDDAPVQAPLRSVDTNYSDDDEAKPYHSQLPAPAQNEAPTYSFITSQPAPSTDMYSGGGYTGGGTASGFGEVMGSGPALQQGFASTDTSMGAQTFDSLPHAPSMKELEDLKSKSKEADSIAKEAEASRRQLVAQLEELRRVADEAESKARAATEKPIKKKGLLGRGGVQKKDAKEAQRLATDARDKKEALLLVQAQVKDAESLAVATKQEAERLLKEAEEAQMTAAAAASMQDQTLPPAANGYPKQAAPPLSYGMGPSYGMASKPPMPQPPPYKDGNHGFDANVMGGGGDDGIRIPTPSGADDPYSNPFE